MDEEEFAEVLQRAAGEDFYRCHHIAEYDNESITLTNGDKVYLTKKKYSRFVKVYM